MFISAFTSARHLSLSGVRPIQSTTSQTIVNIHLILSSHLCLSLPSGPFPSGFPTKTLYTPQRHSFIHQYSALEAGMAGTRAQSCDRCGSGTLHPGQVLGGSLPLLSPAFRRSHFRLQVSVRPKRRQRSQHSERWNCGREICPVILPKFRLPYKFSDLLHAVNLRHGTDGFTSPPKEAVLRTFFALKNPTSSVGFEPANLGTKGQHATPRPPKPLNNDRTLKKMFNTKPDGVRRIGRPKLRWEDGVDQDMRISEVKNWKKVAFDKDEWAKLLKKARAHQGLSSQ